MTVLSQWSSNRVSPNQSLDTIPPCCRVPCVSQKLRNLGPDGCDALLKVSPYMCRRDEDGLYLPCGAILAFFDEVPTHIGATHIHTYTYKPAR